MNNLLQTITLGVIATLVMDVLAWIQFHLYGKPAFNYAFLGRWFLSLKDLKFFHRNIVSIPAIKYERFIGWTLHYVIGVVLCYLYLEMQMPILNHGISIFISSILFGLSTTLIPLFIMLPMLGFGVLASKTPNPKISIKNSLIAHTNFGIGLFVAQLFINLTL